MQKMMTKEEKVLRLVDRNGEVHGLAPFLSKAWLERREARHMRKQEQMYNAQVRRDARTAERKQRHDVLLRKHLQARLGKVALDGTAI